jgi:hypothetical protein
MKKLKLIHYLTIVVSSLMIMSCTHDTEYITGPQGDSGLDGLDGLDGVDGVDFSADCRTCHSNEHRGPINDAYAISGHATGGSWARGTSASCARCHNNEGYVDYLSGNFVTEDEDTGEEFQSADPDGYLVSNPITCTGCHSDHRSFDFENDGNDYALRNIDGINLFIDQTVSLDMTNDIDPLGLNNTCINCHQPRNSYIIPAGTEDYEITSSRFGPHHGPQSTMLEGIMGANIPGSEGYPAVASATHRTGASCITCHMGETTNSLDGSHTWNPTANACIACHPSGAPEEIAGFTEDMATLKAMLLAVDPSPLLDTDRTVPGIYPANVAKATWNYRTVLEDQSKGIHNPAYTNALLKNSIEALQN